MKSKITTCKWIPRNIINQEAVGNLDEEMDFHENLDANQPNDALSSDENDQAHLFSVSKEDIELIENDPYLDANIDEDSDDANAREAELIKASDCLLITATTDLQQCTVELWINDYVTNAFYVHHEILTKYPTLSLDWIPPTDKYPHVSCVMGFYGSNDIEFWNIEDLNSLEPTLILKNKKNKDKKKRSVLTLHHNKNSLNFLASGSADKKIRLWDLLEEKIVAQYKHHEAEVTHVKWHPVEETVLLSSGEDKVASVIDVRSPTDGLQKEMRKQINACIWLQSDPTKFLISYGKGSVACYDIRGWSKGSTKPFWKKTLHESVCTGMADYSGVPIFMTTATDGQAHVWAIQKNQEIVNLTNRHLNAGTLYDVDKHPDIQSLFACVGNVPVLWDINESSAVSNFVNEYKKN